MTCSFLSEAGDSIAGDNDNTNTFTPHPDVTIYVTDLQAIQQRIEDLGAAKRNSCCCRQFDSEFDHEHAAKRIHLKGKSPEDYWGESNQKLDAFICQCEINFKIDGCTSDVNQVNYASFFICRTPEKEWDEFADRKEQQESYIIT